MASLDLLLVLALKEESQGLFEAAGFQPFYCGVGAIKASHSLTSRIAAHKPKHVINLGTAGSRIHSPNSLVECRQFIQRVPHDFMPLKAKIINVEPITSLTQVLCGSADFIEKSEPVIPCDIFDMEAYALAYVCQQMQTKFTAIKYISDQSSADVILDWKKNVVAASGILLACYRDLITKM